MLSLDPLNFEYLQETSWSEVFGYWRENEAHQARWSEHYTNLGFASWDEWRSNHVAPLTLDSRAWTLYRVVNPLQSIPDWYGGPFVSWKKQYYGDKDSLTFAELAQLPDIQQNPVIKELAAQFPVSTSLIGLVQNDRVVILEGMHRCCALALLASHGQHVTTNITIALTDFSGDSIPFLDSRKKNP